jgi:hypothetical protein
MQLNVNSGWENPSASPTGHIVVSESESMKKRMGRLGRIKTLYNHKATLTQNTPTSLMTVAPTDGYVAIPLKISCAINAPGLVYIQWYQRQTQGSESGGSLNYFSKYLPQAGNWELDLSGEVTIGNGCNLTIYMTADNASSYGWASIIYSEELE